MLFGASNVKEIQALKEILELLCLSTRMELNNKKSSIRVNELEAEEKEILERQFPFEILNLDVKIKYLGFVIKPNSYGYANWR